jgi:hypothetical protein
MFDGGNAYLDREYPRLDRIVRATVAAERQQQDRAALVRAGAITTGAHTR